MTQPPDASLYRIPAADLMTLTDSQTLWVPGGDHSWKDDESLVEARYYAAELTRFRRASGETECTHAMGSADLVVHHILPRGYSRAEAAFVLYNHDRLENNRGLVTASDICLTAWKGDPALIPFLIDQIELFTDSPDLRRKARLREQVQRANEDGLGLLRGGRILEKLNALQHDILFMETNGQLPFQGDKKRFKTYLCDRIEAIDAIRPGGHREIAAAKTLYMKTAAEAIRLAYRVENEGRPAPWFGQILTRRTMEPTRAFIATSGALRGLPKIKTALTSLVL